MKLHLNPNPNPNLSAPRVRRLRDFQ